MLSIETASTDWRSIDLVSVPSDLAKGDEERLRDRLQIGVPNPRLLSPEECRDAKPTLGEYDLRQGQLRFVFMPIDVSFVGDEDKPHIEAKVNVRLTGAQGVIARAISPVKAWSPAPRINTITISAKIKFELPFVNGEGTWVRESQESSPPYLVATGEGTSQVRWQFRGTRSDPVEGIYSLNLIAELPRSAVAYALVAVSSKVHKRRPLLRDYRAEVPQDLSIIPLPTE
jgi:hypothetical protein